jgi:predicted lipoprotein
MTLRAAACPHGRPPRIPDGAAQRSFFVIRRRFLGALSVVGASLAIGGCMIVATPVKKTGDADEANGGGFAPDAMVNAIWDAKVIPYLAAKAGTLPDVMTLMRSNPDEAGRKYGYRAKEGNEPWTFVLTIDGRIVSAETTSRAATIGVDTKGDGKIATVVQIGPAIRGTALRDCLDFVSFNDFKNQIDYAQFGKAFNQRVMKTILAQLPRDSLVGRDVKILGAFTLESGDRPPLVTPAQLTLGAAP